MNSPSSGARLPEARLAPAAAGPLLALVFLLVSAPVAAQTGTPAAAPDQLAPASESFLRELEVRVEGLERRLGASALLDLVSRIDRLTKEVQQLRDRNEIQAHELEELRGRQKDLYAELDRLAQRIAQPAPEVAGVPPVEEAAPRPVVGSGAGSSAATDVATTAGEPGESGDAAPEGVSPGTAEPVRESTTQYDPVEEQARYQLAFDLLSEGRFERAASAFAEFQATFPDSRYRDNAQFWQGECLYALRRFEPALGEFQALVENHPESSRIAGAKLKIGIILNELGRSAEAAEVLRALVEAAPDSSEAKLARDRLARLE